MANIVERFDLGFLSSIECIVENRWTFPSEVACPEATKADNDHNSRRGLLYSILDEMCY